MPESSPSTRLRDALILAFALFFPTVLTHAYFVWGQTAAPSAAKYLYLVGKTIQFVFPVAIASFVLKTPWKLRPFSRRGVLVGTLFGLAVGATIFFVGRWGLTSGAGAIGELATRLRGEFSSRVETLGLTSKGAFLAVSIFYSIAHSGLEEYYWRWFTFGRLSRLASFVPAALATNAAFALHHIVVLGAYFGYGAALTWICSFGVFVGGFVWQTIYHKSDSIYGGWISHGFVDAGIYALGFFMLP